MKSIFVLAMLATLTACGKYVDKPNPNPDDDSKMECHGLATDGIVTFKYLHVSPVAPERTNALVTWVALDGTVKDTREYWMSVSNKCIQDEGLKEDAKTPAHIWVACPVAPISFTAADPQAIQPYGFQFTELKSASCDWTY